MPDQHKEKSPKGTNGYLNVVWDVGRSRIKTGRQFRMQGLPWWLILPKGAQEACDVFWKQWWKHLLRVLASLWCCLFWSSVSTWWQKKPILLISGCWLFNVPQVFHCSVKWLSLDSATQTFWLFYIWVLLYISYQWWLWKVFE